MAEEERDEVGTVGYGIDCIFEDINNALDETYDVACQAKDASEENANVMRAVCRRFESRLKLISARIEKIEKKLE